MYIHEKISSLIIFFMGTAIGISSEDTFSDMHGWKVPHGVPFQVMEETWTYVVAPDTRHCENWYLGTFQREKRLAAVLMIRRKDVEKFKQYLPHFVENYESRQNKEQLLTLPELLNELQKVYNELLFASSQNRTLVWASVEQRYESSKKKSPAESMLRFFMDIYDLDVHQ